MLEEKQALPRARGRPRAYDPDRALAAAMQAFWRLGFAGTSLEALSAATDMNRPSMYAAFGDKRTLYRKTLESYISTAQQQIERIFDSQASFAAGLTGFFTAALAWYLPEGEPPRGCYLIATAATECMVDEDVKRRMQTGLERFEELIVERVRHAQAAGELPLAADATALASMVLGITHTLALRARAGVARAALERIVEGAVRTICSSSDA